MDEEDFEGTLVLEKLAAIGKVEDFFDAIDSDNMAQVVSLMKKAQVDSETIALVVRNINDSNGT